MVNSSSPFNSLLIYPSVSFSYPFVFSYPSLHFPYSFCVPFHSHIVPILAAPVPSLSPAPRPMGLIHNMWPLPTKLLGLLTVRSIGWKSMSIQGAVCLQLHTLINAIHCYTHTDARTVFLFHKHTGENRANIGLMLSFLHPNVRESYCAVCSSSNH